jgi:hypothetical protein
VVKGVWTVAVAIGVKPMLIKKSRRGGGRGRWGRTVAVVVMVVIVVEKEMVAAAVIALEQSKRVEPACAATIVVAVIVVSVVVVEAKVGLARVFKGVESGDGHCSAVVYLFFIASPCALFCVLFLLEGDMGEWLSGRSMYGRMSV